MTGYFQVLGQPPIMGQSKIMGQQKYIEYGTYRQAFGLLKKTVPIIAVVGAGGKTTLIELLAEEYAEAGSRVIVTTTTHMLCPKKASVLFIDDMTAMEKANVTENLENERKFLYEKISQSPTGILYIAAHAADFAQSGKLAPISDGFQKALFQCGYPIIIEADGSKKLPCKVPAVHEPVIPDETTTVIGVLSTRAVGQQIKSCCHRAELAAELLKKSIEDEIEFTDLEKIAESSQGLRKSVQDTMEFYAVLNCY